MHHPMDDGPAVELEGVDPVSYEVYLALRDTTHYQRQLMQRQFGEKGRHPGQGAALGMLAAHEGISQRELADKLHVSAPTVTAMLQRLEASGVIERRDDEQDQRVTRVFLTDAGREMLREVRSVFANVITTGVGSMPEADRRELARLLRQLSDNMAKAL